MSEIARWDLWDGQMSQSVSGLWVRYAAHEFEVERLATERDEARAEVERLKAEVERLKDEARRVSRLRRDEELGCCDTFHYGEVSR